MFINPIMQFRTLSNTIFIWLQTTVTVGKIRQQYHSNRIAFLKKRLQFSALSAPVKKMTREFFEDKKNQFLVFRIDTKSPRNKTQFSVVMLGPARPIQNSKI